MYEAGLVSLIMTMFLSILKVSSPDNQTGLLDVLETWRLYTP